MAISPDFDGKFDPVAVRTLPDLKSASPLPKERKPVVFVTGAPSIDAVRLWVDGKPLGSGSSAAPPAAVAKTSPPAATSPPASSPDADPLATKTTSLIQLSRSLPQFFQAQPLLKFARRGERDGEGPGLILDGQGVRTRNADFLTKDFTFDVVYRVAPDSNDNIFVGIGDDKMDRDRFPGAAGGHLYASRHEGMVKLSMGRVSETVIAKAGRGNGPHLFRLQKVGNTLTLAVSPDFDGKFDPVASTTVPELKTAGSFLTAENAPLFIRGKGVIERVGLSIGGKPASGFKQAVTQADAPADGAPSAQTPADETPDMAPDATADAADAADAGEPAPPPSAAGPAAKIRRRQTSIRGLTVSLGETGVMFGSTTDLILTATPGEARPNTPVEFVTPVGDQMKLVVDDVLRSVRIRYPEWEAEKIELSFDDRVSSKDGSSIGAAVGTLILSMLEGYEIDEKLAMTGDVTADGKVRAIGGVVAKVRAATSSGAAIVALPAGNYDQVADGLVFEGPTLLSNIQVVGIGTLNDAVAIARVDRPEKLAQAMKLFAEVQAAVKKSPTALQSKVVRDKLTQIVGLAPNHHSAQLLLLASQGKQPRRLSSTASLYYMAVAVRGVMPALREQSVALDRRRVTPVAVKEGLKQLDRLRGIADPAMQALVDAYREFIRAVSAAQSGGGVGRESADQGPGCDRRGGESECELRRDGETADGGRLTGPAGRAADRARGGRRGAGVGCRRGSNAGWPPRDAVRDTGKRNGWSCPVFCVQVGESLHSVAQCGARSVPPTRRA